MCQVLDSINWSPHFFYIKKMFKLLNKYVHDFVSNVLLIIQGPSFYGCLSLTKFVWGGGKTLGRKVIRNHFVAWVENALKEGCHGNDLFHGSVTWSFVFVCFEFLNNTKVPPSQVFCRVDRKHYCGSHLKLPGYKCRSLSIWIPKPLLNALRLVFLPCA